MILDNTFDLVQTHSFSGTNNLFNFSGNSVANIENDAFQMSAREIDISNNIFGSVSGKNSFASQVYVNKTFIPINILISTGSPMLSLSPTPECIPDSAQYGNNL